MHTTLPMEKKRISKGTERHIVLHSPAEQTHSLYEIEAGATLNLDISSIGTNIDHSVECRVIGEGGISNISWTLHGKERDRMKIGAKNIFDAPNGGGEITIRGVAEDKAQMDVEGFIEITKNGHGTDTYLTEKILMLDHTAKVNVVPGLEIKTNDVKASHSATVTKVSEEDIFYFGSRGIPREEARRMFVEGFLNYYVGGSVPRIANFATASKRAGK